MRKMLTAGLAAGAVVGALLAGTAGADAEKTYGDITYVCTGIGEERDNPKWATYPAKIMLTTNTGAYVANADITIQDETGAVVLEATCNGPWLLADLKPGRYEVSAKVDRYLHRETMTVSDTGQAVITMRFWEIAG
ncbi:MAG TPA: hypothetical protein VF274_08320 [Alphaproteobacteria bacterium]|jgi:hypothetical protein